MARPPWCGRASPVVARLKGAVQACNSPGFVIVAAAVLSFATLQLAASPAALTPANALPAWMQLHAVVGAAGGESSRGSGGDGERVRALEREVTALRAELAEARDAAARAPARALSSDAADAGGACGNGSASLTREALDALEAAAVRRRDTAAFPCACSAACSCGALFVISSRTPQQAVYRTLHGGRKPHLAYLGVALRSFKAHNPALKVAVFTDDEAQLAHLRQYIDFVGAVDTAGQTKPWAEVLVSMTRTPWAKTLYLDADVEVCAPLDEVFDVLDHVDVAAVRTRRRAEDLLAAIDGGPAAKAAHERYPAARAFRLYSAVFGYRNTSTSRAIVAAAHALDQSTDWDHMNNLIHAMAAAHAPSVHVLPDEFLYVGRANEYPVYFTSAVRIIHAGNATSCAAINTPVLPRLFDNNLGFPVVAAPRRDRSAPRWRWAYWNYWWNPAYMSLASKPVRGNESDALLARALY